MDDADLTGGAGAGSGTDSVAGSGVHPDPQPPQPGPLSFPLRDLLGFSVHAADGRATATIVCDERHHNPHGVVHGAVIFAILDTAMGAATLSVLAPGQRCTTIDIHTRYLAAVVRGRLRADIEVIKAGRRIVHLDGRVTDEHGRDIARASASFAVLPAEEAGEPSAVG